MRNDNKIYIWQNSKDRREKIIDGIILEDYDRRKEEEKAEPYTGVERRRKAWPKWHTPLLRGLRLSWYCEIL